ncbi:MAG: acyl-CoA dehydratase activase-related protein [candidate division WOR-3 bacterium]|jgi:predicted nucleotide-binding protein (sugar kinase/HSP70/actin superfamily)|nr:acyl-CoA dehydratase activase-related protein [candidate division WOR-3 bacterium]MDH7518682.1 acyl-CoA dehydratase activase-related protein [bacterium]
MQIGICRALHTFHHFVLWKTFLNELGFETILTPNTTPEIVEAGLKIGPAELCLPVKVFLGHFQMLQEKADVIFIPRLVCRKVVGDYYFGCPKALALPDLIKALFPSSTEIVELIIDERISSEKMAFVNIAGRLGRKKEDALKAYQVAQAAACSADELTRRLETPIHIFNELKTDPYLSIPPGFKIGVIGHPYLLFDDCLNGQIFEFLVSCGAKPVVFFPTEEQIMQSALTKNVPNWYYELELITGARQLIQDESIKGLLLYTNFACGTGSIVNEFIRREGTRKRKIPILTILIDEHTSESGLKTRLEAFIDLLKAQRH